MFRWTRTAAATMLCASAFAAYAQQQPTLAKIAQTGTINLSYRESSVPFSYLSDAKPVGFSVEICDRIVDTLKTKVKRPDLKIERMAVTSQNRIPLVVNGTVDLECGSTTNNAARAKDVDFAYNTYMEVVRIAVRANSGIKDLKDLNGKTVATTTGTTSVQILRKNERAQGIDFKESMGKDHSDSFLLLESGRADAFVMDASILAKNISTAKNPKDFAIVGPELSVEPIACMMRKDDTAFGKVVNDSIARQMKDGSLAKLYDKWMVQPVPPSNVALELPLSEATKSAWANPSTKPAEDFAKR